MPDGEEQLGAWDSLNYLNYFTEIEERFRAARGTGLFLMSPLDWALVESWKDAGIPLEAVLKGIDEAFEKWRAKKSKTSQVNSIAYCAQAVAEAARRHEQPREARAEAGPAIPAAEIARHLEEAARKLPDGYGEVAEALRGLAVESERWAGELEELEQRLTALEEKLLAMVRAGLSEEKLFALRQAMESQLRPYRSKFKGPELMLLEKKFLDQRLFEEYGLPRLSLFYL